MSRKSQRNQPAVPPPAAPPPRGRKAIIGSIAALAVAFIVGVLVYTSERAPTASAASANRAYLERLHAPVTGAADARVQIVEFMDPACGTCAAFFPFVKQLMAENPGRIRLTVRHVAFHKGADEVVRMLEAARRQDKYWVTLERVLATQERWAVNHVARADLVWPELAGLGLDLERLRADMAAPEVATRMKQDMQDAGAVGVSKTPEYYVNGRPLPSFGYEPLAALVREELQRAYR